MLKKACFLAIAIGLCAEASAMNFSILSDVVLTDNTEEDSNSEFKLGQIDMFVSGQASENTQGLLEVVFEDADGWVVDVERIWIKHKIRDELYISAGRFHTPLGHYNRTYHHGALFQLTATRPFFLDFEDGELAVLPTHIVGFMATGEIAAQDVVINYEFGISNGPAVNTGDDLEEREIDMSNAGDANNSKSTNLRLSFETEFGFGAGIFYMDNTVAEDGDIADSSSGLDRGETLSEQTISGLDLRYDYENFHLMAEYFNIKNKTELNGGSDEAAQAYFVEFSYDIDDKHHVGYRYEDLSIEDGDIYFSDVFARESADNHVIAYRYNLNFSNAIKLQVNRFGTDNSDEETYYTVQWSYLFN